MAGDSTLCRPLIGPPLGMCVFLFMHACICVCMCVCVFFRYLSAYTGPVQNEPTQSEGLREERRGGQMGDEDGGKKNPFIVPGSLPPTGKD